MDISNLGELMTSSDLFLSMNVGEEPVYGDEYKFPTVEDKIIAIESEIAMLKRDVKSK